MCPKSRTLRLLRRLIAISQPPPPPPTSPIFPLTDHSPHRGGRRGGRWGRSGTAACAAGPCSPRSSARDSIYFYYYNCIPPKDVGVSWIPNHTRTISNDAARDGQVRTLIFSHCSKSATSISLVYYRILPLQYNQQLPYPSPHHTLF